MYTKIVFSILQTCQIHIMKSKFLYHFHSILWIVICIDLTFQIHVCIPYFSFCFWICLIIRNLWMSLRKKAWTMVRLGSLFNTIRPIVARFLAVKSERPSAELTNRNHYASTNMTKTTKALPVSLFPLLLTVRVLRTLKTVQFYKWVYGFCFCKH